MINHQSDDSDRSHHGGSPAVRYDRDDTEPLSVATATAIARFNGEDATEATTRLYDVIDPDALDALFADRYDGIKRSDGFVRFETTNARVVVSPAQIEVYSRD